MSFNGKDVRFRNVWKTSTPWRPKDFHSASLAFQSHGFPSGPQSLINITLGLIMVDPFCK